MKILRTLVSISLITLSHNMAAETNQKKLPEIKQLASCLQHPMIQRINRIITYYEIFMNEEQRSTLNSFIRLAKETPHMEGAKKEFKIIALLFTIFFIGFPVVDNHEFREHFVAMCKSLSIVINREKIFIIPSAIVLFLIAYLVNHVVEKPYLPLTSGNAAIKGKSLIGLFGIHLYILENLLQDWPNIKSEVPTQLHAEFELLHEKYNSYMQTFHDSISNAAKDRTVVESFGRLFNINKENVPGEVIKVIKNIQKTDPEKLDVLNDILSKNDPVEFLEERAASIIQKLIEECIKGNAEPSSIDLES